MYIKSITLDGFKSYGNRVEITGFDPAFNAITGLNGTGKSNILDSICFVLGITNLSNVRASSLQELIYKHGQAGITKATVSITFDNRDKSQAPIGYETTDEITITRQIVMGGKNKYLINGINVQNKRVNDLFCSVQLNVNNPHFLIMQGRITKVLNMKPPEILSMIEEAAGTSMYETKKVQAQNTIAKKDAKLAELDDIIKEDIAPKLQKLQDERSQFQEHQQVVREIDGIAKLHVSYRYDTASKKAKELEQKVQDVQADIQAKKDEVKNNAKECKTIDKEIAEINKKLDEENSSILKGLEEELSSLEREEAAAGAAQRAAAEAVSAHQRRQRLLERALADDDAALGAKQAALDQASASFSSLRLAHEAAAAALGAAQAHYLAVSAGREDAAGSLQDQLIAAKRAASEAGTRVAQAGMERAAAEAALARLRRELAAAGDDTQRDRDAVQRAQQELDRLTREAEGARADAEQHAALGAGRRALAEAARAARDGVDALAARVQRCDFKYAPPQPDFDPARVHGTIARLIEVSDPVYCTALETAAGGRLYNVVVDTDVTSKLLLQRGNLQARTTIIPLNKISGAAIDPATVAAAQDIGGGAEAVQLALELVRYERALAPAMRWVFGNTLVCRDLDTAKRVCFHPRVRRRCVTRDGDVFDPAGTLSGGARSKSGSVLVQLQELQAAERALRLAEQQLQQCDERLAGLQHAADAFLAHSQRCDMLQHELGVLRARLAASAHAQAQQEMEALDAQVAALRADEARDRGEQQASAAAAAELEAKLRDIKGHREREFKKAEEALRDATAAAERHGAAWRAREQELEALRLEGGALQAAADAARAQLAAAAAAAAPLQHARDLAARQHDAALEAVRGVAARLARQKAEAAGRSGEVARRAERRDALLQRSRDAELGVQQLEFHVKELQEQAAAQRHAMVALESENGWIAAEKQFFGAAGGAYDFEARQASLAGRRLAQLAERRDKLARGLNARAHTLLGKEEEQYQELLRKKRIVEADRAKLVQVMRELDEKKRSTLLEACAQVNRDFGSIFSALLPGAAARLQPPPGAGALAGLQVQVGFNGAWKRALAELSGGQRSLVALSLVLAMLRFRPAPLYVLDEVDAALDLAHTQNIGAMLRDHFTTSQFIIVSLKDGMFNNANVLFRTRFVDGMSSVQRTLNQRAPAQR